MTRLLLQTIEYTARITNPRSDLEMIQEMYDYLEDRESWQWAPGWTLKLLTKKDNFYTFVVEGEYNDEI